MHYSRMLSASVCLLSVSLMACKKKQVAPVVSPETKTTAAEAAGAASNDDPLQWPVTLLLDENGRAIPPKTSQVLQSDERMMAELFEEQEHGMWIANPSGAYRQPFKNIVRPAPKTIQKGAGRTHEVKPNGARAEYDGDTGSFIEWGANGSALVWNGVEGTYTYRDPGGNVTQTVPQGEGQPGDTTSSNQDGSFDSRDEDGSGVHLYPPDQPGPGGSIGYSYGPGGPNDGRTDLFDDGGSVDLPAPLYDGSGPGGDKLSNGVGEPHYTTRDGTGYTTQAAGEFVLVSGMPGREVQARHQPWKGSESFSAITAMAFRVGESKVEFRLDGTVLLDGKEAPEGVAVQGDIPGGGALGVWRKEGKMQAGVVVWPDLSAIWLIPHDGWLDFHLQWNGLAPEHRGLLGSDDDNATNDLTCRDGTIAETEEKSLASFVNSWRVSAAESLFTYKTGESVATYALLDFPKQPAVAKFTALAEELCKDMEEGWAKQQCFYDISMTGDKSFALSYQELLRRQKAIEARSIKKESGTAQPRDRAADVLQLNPAERDAALAAELNATIKETLGAGVSKVYRITVADVNSAPVSILSENLEPGVKYSADRAGYALFDEQGKSVAGTVAASSDMNFAALTPGTYYLKIVGPGPIHIKIN